VVNFPGVAVLRNTKAGLLDERLTAKIVEDLVRIRDRNRIFKFGSLESIVIAPPLPLMVKTALSPLTCTRTLRSGSVAK